MSAAETTDVCYLIARSGGARPARYGDRFELTRRCKTQQLSAQEVEEKFDGTPLPFRVKKHDRDDGTVGDATVIGAGCYSIATRHLVENSATNRPTSIVAVSKPLIGHAIDDYSRRPNGPEDFLSKFSHPYSLMVARGFDGKPAVYKVSAEVKGATIHDLGPMYLFANRKFLEQYIEFASMVKEMFLHSPMHYFADTVGRQNKNQLTKMWEHLFQFNSDNLMLDQEKNLLRFVDTGLVDHIDSFTQASLMKKLRILYLYCGLTLTSGIAHMALFGHHLLDQLAKVDKPAENTEETARFEQGFGEIMGYFNKSGVDYRVLGSFAFAGHIINKGGELHLTPWAKGKRRDVDIVVLNKDESEIAVLIKELREISRVNPNSPQISLLFPYSGRQVDILDGQAKDGKVGGLSNLRYEDGKQKMVHRYKDLILHHRQEDLEPVEVVYAGTTFKTVHQDTLAGLALIRMGAYKFKDLAKVGTFFETTQASLPPKYVDFAKRVRQMYPETYRRSVIREYHHFLPAAVRIFLKENSILSPVVKRLLMVG